MRERGPQKPTPASAGRAVTKTMEYKDYYRTLGLERSASPAEIKKAYRRLARELHPDRNPGDKTAEARFKEVNEAHEVLADTTKRQQYDMLGSNWDQFARAGGAGSAGANQYAGDPFGPGGPFAAYGAAGQGGNVRYQFHSTGTEDFSDFFRMFFSGAAAPDAAGSAASARKGRGPRDGRRSGNPLDELFSRMRTDGGASTATQSAAGAGGAGAQRAGPAARNKGTRHGDDIEVDLDLSLEEAFHGSARLVQVGDRRLEVKVPAGVETGSKIRLSGKAGSGADAGDLYLITKIRPHSIFTRTGADLTREVPITLGEALLGGEVEVETLRGRVILKVPAGTQQGQTFRLAGQGMPRLKDDGSGDLFARIKVVMPGKLEGRQRKAAEEFLRQIVQPNPRTKL
ncbi:MAG: DnaJ C-terminal domain-containing protein [Candidatus Limnocylindrales bacterium]